MLTLYPWLGLIAILRGTFAALVNFTVDDTDHRITYSPPNDWSYGPTCTTCTSHVDSSKTYNGSWHDTIFSPQDPAENFTQTIEFSFIGAAVYVFGILSNAIDNPSGDADYLIFVDGEQVQNFVHTASGDGMLVYNSTLYANASLSHEKHTLKVQNGQPHDESSFILFDYVVYSTDDEGPTAPVVASGTSSRRKLSLRDKVLTGVLVPVLVILTVVVALFCRRARAHASANSRLNRMTIASPFLSSKSEEYNHGFTSSINPSSSQRFATNPDALSAERLDHIQHPGSAGYPLNAAWLETASREDGSEPPAYASEAGSS